MLASKSLEDIFENLCFESTKSLEIFIDRRKLASFKTNHKVMLTVAVNANTRHLGKYAVSSKKESDCV